MFKQPHGFWWPASINGRKGNTVFILPASFRIVVMDIAVCRCPAGGHSVVARYEQGIQWTHRHSYSRNKRLLDSRLLYWKARMEQEPVPLYGELVIDTPHEDPSRNPEIETMEEQIRLMIEEAAYYLAEKRGFAPGHELEDWLRAKDQIAGRR